ncbi:hypothetical protein B4U79_16854 [Dinothrombium tinctorium]|uniref:LIM zinc-binding domain-containing protein n=1 Tax=Dinothrombium tinctorium TaxID=1965070 RepID=A0A3S3PEY7_9ACAR|nr:hypothetical protein B4U79_16999 [Dinothrombium tinctorium]RWS00515.1 hypothetical protein B4U79_16854 [Dinothrombium tinctorium]
MEKVCHQIDPDCPACSKPIYWRAKVLFKNRLWHKECFRCCRCCTTFSLSDAENIYFGEDLFLRCFYCNTKFERKKQGKDSESDEEISPEHVGIDEDLFRDKIKESASDISSSRQKHVSVDKKQKSSEFVNTDYKPESKVQDRKSSRGDETFKCTQKYDKTKEYDEKRQKLNGYQSSIVKESKYFYHKQKGEELRDDEPESFKLSKSYNHAGDYWCRRERNHYQAERDSYYCRCCKCRQISTKREISDKSSKITQFAECCCRGCIEYRKGCQKSRERHTNNCYFETCKSKERTYSTHHEESAQCTKKSLCHIKMKDKFDDQPLCDRILCECSSQLV